MEISKVLLVLIKNLKNKLYEKQRPNIIGKSLFYNT